MQIGGWKIGLFSLLIAGLILPACSSMTIPIIVLRRLNDVGIIYQTDYKGAENAVTSVIKEMGCTVRYINRVPGTLNGQSVEAEGSMTVVGQCPGDAKYPKAFGFEVDVDRVPGQPSQRKIRIGCGDFGDQDLAIRFHQLLMKKLTVVPESINEKHAEKLSGAPADKAKVAAAKESGKTAESKNGKKSGAETNSAQADSGKRFPVTGQPVAAGSPAYPTTTSSGKAVPMEGGMVEELEIGGGARALPTGN